MAPTEEKKDLIADYCGDIDMDCCRCVQSTGYRERLGANPHCAVCGGSGTPNVDSIMTGLDKLGEDIDQLASTANYVCEPAALYLELAWWHVENAFRKVSGRPCSAPRHKDSYCECCKHFEQLRAKAGRSL